MDEINFDEILDKSLKNQSFVNKPSKSDRFRAPGDLGSVQDDRSDRELSGSVLYVHRRSTFGG